LPVRYASISFVGLLAIAATSTLIGPSFPLIKNEFGLSLELLGVLASAWSAGYLLSLVGGFLSDRYGELFVISASLATVGAAAALISVASSYDLLLVLFLCGGIGSAFGEAGMNPLIYKLFPKRSGFALNILHLFFCLGSFVGPVLAALFITAYGSWRLSYLVMACAFLPLLLISIHAALKMHATSFSRHVTEETKGNVSTTEILKHGRALMVTGFFYLGSEQGINAWLPTFLVLVRGFSIELAGLSLGLFWGAMAAGRLVLGSVTDRLHFRRMIILSALLSTALISVGIIATNQLLTLISWPLSGFFMAPIMPTVFAWTSRLFPKRSGFATGVIYGIGFAGGVFSPWLLGVLSDQLSLTQAMPYLALSLMIICITMVATVSKNQEDGLSEPS
jgi:fucose permease